MKKFKIIFMLIFILFCVNNILFSESSPIINEFKTYINEVYDDNISVNNELTFKFEVNDLEGKINKILIDYGDNITDEKLCDNQSCSGIFYHSYNKSGIYYAILKAYDNNNKETIKEVKIRVYNNDEYFVANWGEDTETCQSPSHPCKTLSYTIAKENVKKIFIIPSDNQLPDIEESLNIDKSIILSTDLYSNKLATIKRKTENYVFHIQSSNVVIKNLKIFGDKTNDINNFSNYFIGIEIETKTNLDNITLKNLFIGWKDDNTYYTLKYGIKLKNNNFTTLSNLVIDNVSVFTGSTYGSYPIYGGIIIDKYYATYIGYIGEQHYDNITIQHSKFAGFNPEIYLQSGAENIFFYNNVLCRIHLPVSSHSFYKNIIIKNNKFNECGNWCIKNECGKMYDIIIDNNSFSNFYWGILLGKYNSCSVDISSNIKIINNTIKNAKAVGIGLSKVYNSKIINNLIDNSSGPNLKLESCSYNLIDNNTITNSQGNGFIVSLESQKNYEENQGGLNLYNSSYNVVKNNLFKNNNQENLLITEENSFGNTIFNNIFEQNFDYNNFRIIRNAKKNLIFGNNFKGGNIIIYGDNNFLYFNAYDSKIFMGDENYNGIWNSSVKIAYKYYGYDTNSPAIVKNFVGNYYSKLNIIDENRDGLNDEKYQIKLTNNNLSTNSYDNSPLSENLSNYNLQLWFLGNDKKLYKYKITENKNILLENNKSIIWIAEETQNINFAKGLEEDNITWTGQLLFKDPLSKDTKIKIEIGKISSNTFTPEVETVIIGNGINNLYYFKTNAKSFSTDSESNLAIKITNLNSVDNITLISGGGFSFISPPVDKLKLLLDIKGKPGKVISYPNGINYTCFTEDNCTGSNYGKFFKNTFVKLSAYPIGNDFTLKNWDSNIGKCEFKNDNKSICYFKILDENNLVNINAVFDYISYPFNIVIVGKGKVINLIKDNFSINQTTTINIYKNSYPNFEIVSDEGYYIDNLTLDNTETLETQKAIGLKKFTFKSDTPIQKEHTLEIIFKQSEKFITELNKNWNLISLPGFEQIDMNNKFKQLEVNIWKWNNNKWMIYSNNEKVKNLINKYKIEKIDTIKAGEGFWIFTNSSYSLIFYPTKQYTPEIVISSLKNGWNLIGTGKEILTENLSKYFNNFDHIWIWQDNKWYVYTENKNLKNILKEFKIEEFKKIKRGQGFWIFINK